MLAIKTGREIFRLMKAYIQNRVSVLLYHALLLFASFLLIATTSLVTIDRSLSLFGDFPLPVTSMIIVNETIRNDLVVFLVIFADLATVAIAYDNQKSRPEEEECSRWTDGEYPWVFEQSCDQA